MAADGVGLWGRTDDKVITFFAFAVMAFFTILVTVLSLIQIRLESRKERIRQRTGAASPTRLNNSAGSLAFGYVSTGLGPRPDPAGTS